MLQVTEDTHVLVENQKEPAGSRYIKTNIPAVDAEAVRSHTSLPSANWPPAPATAGPPAAQGRRASRTRGCRRGTARSWARHPNGLNAGTSVFSRNSPQQVGCWRLDRLGWLGKERLLAAPPPRQTKAEGEVSQVPPGAGTGCELGSRKIEPGKIFSRSEFFFSSASVFVFPSQHG